MPARLSQVNAVCDPEPDGGLTKIRAVDHQRLRNALHERHDDIADAS
jgi:hypothetical protein